ncbi:universal stress protein [Desulfosarcina ovata subsp. sediminis]|uniref:Universal stress protein n=1 Tax=Desulfosarcina ovata subsp. sediminis TaxID=885957 RepID=A0A5K8A0X7_9BACT|nr:universal stress protein [Desulfosarcina ovata]BBO86061.1 universal stress protein [Desulfosarcina ovata subsp. sediminis]
MFNRILVASDLVTTADAPVLSAIGLARQQGSRIFLLHVMESASTENRHQVRHFATDETIHANPAYEATVAQALARTYGDHLAGLDHGIEVAAGFPWEAILQMAAAVDADLIVLGPHSTRAKDKGVVRTAGRVGSTVENVITRETCPVMVVNRPAQPDQLRFRQVLVPIDFSRACECAVCFAARLAARHASRLQVFHMLPVPPYPKYSHEDFIADSEKARKRLETLCSPYLEGIEHEYRVRAGAMPHLEILKSATETETDLIVLGSHTKEASGKWYPGSVVERVSYRAACPVMVINDPDVLIRWEGSVAPADDAADDHLIHVLTGRVSG